jgi:hypothetical protein
MLAGEKKFSREAVAPRSVDLSSISRPHTLFEADKKEIVPGKAFLRSLILPGWGERYVGEKKSGEIFIGSEIGLWLFWGSLRLYQNWEENGMFTFATGHAGVTGAHSKSDQYLIDLGNYTSVFEYNQEQLRNRNLSGLYNATLDYWYWDSESSRQKYHSLRVSRDETRRNAGFVIAGVVVNHLVSAINALRLARQHNKNLTQKINWQLRSSPAILNSINLTLEISR